MSMKGKALLLMILAFSLFFSGLAWADSQTQELNVTIPVGTHEIRDVLGKQEVHVSGYGCLLIPGKPNLPSKIFALAIPPGAELVEVTFDAGQGIELPGTFEVSPAPLPRVIGQEDPRIYERERQTYERNYRSVYERDEPYPQNVVELVRTAGYRKYNLVDVRVAPFIYRPLSGKLTYFPDIAVSVTYKFEDKQNAVIVDNMARTEKTAREIILNYDQAQSWYPQGLSKDKGLYDFVIITLDACTTSVSSLANWEISKGRSVKVVTTSWIGSTYTGYDLAEKMRNFLRDKYPSGEWGIEDVLLVGHYDDVPMRRCEQDVGYGKPETDLYYAELSLPDYQSWDEDMDRLWGENTDTIDFYSEVNVGRIPWSTPSTVQSICEKSVTYEQENDPSFKKNILLLGAFFWEDTDNAVLMEAKVDQPWMSDWTMTRMYEQNSTVWSSYACDYPLTHSNVMSIWPNGEYAFVNWAGHGSPTSCHIMGYSSAAFIQSSDCSSLNDEYPAIIFADACSNSDTDYLNIGQAMLQQGGVGFLGATKVAYGAGGWSNPNDGSTQSLDYFFTTCVTSGDYTQGQAHQWALRQMYINGLWGGAVKYQMFEWGALWGNPNLGMAPTVSLSIRFPDGLPEHYPPSVPDSLTVQIRENADTYMPGTGLIHYRYDGGTYLTSPLTSLGSDLYMAILPPANCSDTPEFYFSAEGESSGVIYSPADAPATVYTAAVGEFTIFMENDLDSDPGWTTAGQWAFGIPTGGGGEYGGPDPTSGHTGSDVYGYNLSGDYPNNLAETHLTSGAFDCTGKFGVHLKFWRWLGVEQPTYDHAYVRVSNDGTNWVTVWENTSEIADASWTEMDVDISAVADNQSTVYLRWTMGTTDVGWRYCGWNIDDVQLIVFDCESDNPPQAIDDLTCELEKDNIILKWSEPYADKGVASYVIYRSSAVGAAGDSLAGTSDTTYTDVGAAGDVGWHYFYLVKAVDISGQKSAESNQVGEFDLDLMNQPPE